MELLQKVYVFDTEMDFSKNQVGILVNDKDDQLSPKHIFKNLELESGKISGYSLLQFYQVKDGSLFDKDGNQVTFVNKEKKINLIKVRDPLAFIDAPLEVNLQYVKDVASVLGLVEIEKTIYGLTTAEKKILESDRTEDFSKKELAQKEAEAKEAEEKLSSEAKAAEEAKISEAAKKSEEEALAIEEARKLKEAEEAAEQKKKEDEAQAEKEKEQKANEIPQGDDVVTDKQYKLMVRKYQRQGFSQFKEGIYIMFYGSDTPDSILPFIVANMGKYYKKLDGSVIADDDGSCEYEFSSEIGEDKVAILKEGKLEITNL